MIRRNNFQFSAPNEKIIKITKIIFYQIFPKIFPFFPMPATNLQKNVDPEWEWKKKLILIIFNWLIYIINHNYIDNLHQLIFKSIFRILCQNLAIFFFFSSPKNFLVFSTILCKTLIQISKVIIIFVPISCLDPKKNISRS